MLLTRYLHLLVLLIAMRRLFIVYRSLDRLVERLCGRNGGRKWNSFRRRLQRHQANDTDAKDCLDSGNVSEQASKATHQNHSQCHNPRKQSLIRSGRSYVC